ncbi:MAG: CpsD/CapB family tyrosine-protein kinase [Candidatus Zixiibacteriota bacterium]|nr:MAG: CpsD/CapB family tyrosine-protein kinase [candidate division Zixibacteria bacterium]
MAAAPFSIVNVFDLEAPYVTEYRRLLHKILAAGSHSDIKSIMVTSAMIAEGKSTICSFMALTAAVKRGLKTLIIDADLRLPSIHKLFGLPEAPGLVEVLTDGVSPKDAMRKTSVENLDILPSGRQSDNPTEIFDAEAVGNIVEELKFYYDLILIDCAPLLPVSDPMLLASRVDGTILVIKAGTTQRELVERAVGILNPPQNNVLGVVLNNMNHILPYYYDYDYYSYDYRQSPQGPTKIIKKPAPARRPKNKPAEKDPTLKDNIGHS